MIYEGQIKILSEIMPGFQASLENPERKQEIISALIEQELFLQQAQKRKLIQNNTRLQKNLWVQIRNYQAGTYLLEEVDKRTREHYEKQKKELFTQVEIKDIVLLYKSMDGATEAERKENALTKAQDLHATLTPENFSEMASLHTENPVAQVSNGDIGVVSYMDQRIKHLEWKPLIDQAFTLSKGEVSDPIETLEGVHIIQVISDPIVQSFESVESILRSQLEKEVKDEVFQKLLIDTPIEYLDESFRPTQP